MEAAEKLECGGKEEEAVGVDGSGNQAPEEEAVQREGGTDCGGAGGGGCGACAQQWLTRSG